MRLNGRIAAVLLTASGIILELMFILFALNGGGEKSIPVYMLIYFETFLVFFFAYFLVKYSERHKLFHHARNDPEQQSKLLRLAVPLLNIKTGKAAEFKLPLLIILSGIIFRLTLFGTLPSTSPDVYRYVWEGKIIVNGFNPYASPPSSPQLTQLHSRELPAKVTFKNMTAIYPPFAQTVFAASYLISGEKLLGLKLIYLLSEIITMLFLLLLLYLKKKNLNLIILYAWLPLVIMEFFINAHLDPIGIMLLVVTLYMLESGKEFLSAIPFALSVLTKFYPLIIFPLLIKKLGLRKTIVFAAIFAAISIIFLIPFNLIDINNFRSLFAYLSRWEFNGSAYKLIKFILNNGTQAHIVCGLLLTASIGVISILYKDFLKASAGVFICFIIFSATVYPWYLGWMAAINPFVEFYSVLSFFFTINLSNFTPLGEVWKEYPRLILIQYSVFYLFLIYDLYKSKAFNVFRKSKRKS